MKTRIKYILAISTILLFACNKSTIVALQTGGAINVTNAVIGSASIALTTNYSTVNFNGSNVISSNSSVFCPVIGGQVQINLGVLAVPATTTTPGVAAVSYYSNSLNFNQGTNYSLFLTGTSSSAVDNVLITENYPHAYADSVCGVRFINLAPGSNPISINIKGNPNGSEVASLAYKGYSNFIQHPAKRLNASYVFEFRDAATGNLITSYTYSTAYLLNVTLCLRGMVGGTVGVIRDNDY